MPIGPSSVSELHASLREADQVLVGSAALPPDPERAAELYAEAIARGSGAAAARAAMLAAVGVGRVPDWAEAFDRLLEGAVLGDRSARRQLALLADAAEPRAASGEAASPALWRRLRARLDVEALLMPSPVQWLSNEPKVGVIKQFAPPAICKWLIRRSGELLAPGQVNDAATGARRAHNMRSAMAAPYTILNRDVVLAVMQARAERATGLRTAWHEPPNVISYEPGQEFTEHFDFIDPLSPHFRDELALLGQRVVTCVTYLNDGFEGAETYFPLAGLKLRGGVGDCVIFVNVLPDGQPDRRTLHAGLPPTKGRKWILSQWLRDRAQPLI